MKSSSGCLESKRILLGAKAGKLLGNKESILCSDMLYCKMQTYTVRTGVSCHIPSDASSIYIRLYVAVHLQLAVLDGLSHWSTCIGPVKFPAFKYWGTFPKSASSIRTHLLLPKNVKPSQILRRLYALALPETFLTHLPASWMTYIVEPLCVFSLFAKCCSSCSVGFILLVDFHLAIGKSHIQLSEREQNQIIFKLEEEMVDIIEFGFEWVLQCWQAERLTDKAYSQNSVSYFSMYTAH